ncbi:hypothetical protein PENTCL1PPCAC_21804 [Pristionchus entomophagus]|uniref:Uncharacterized protein n=1 Tax=Pristionchus entomophagus TaxID=358040 RepID=A0AAV5TYS5_9BILA|nr:hypothetical protein PENTCL1PPCAC_21804 [Pristionchus entomophagus]
MQSTIVMAATLLAALLIVKASAQEEGRGWNKAYGLWGKRSLPMDDDVMVMDESAMPKRANERSWAKLNNMWGKRAAAPVDWDKRGNWKAANGLWGKRR